eukprot:CAMPEP_0119393502 /NCGR_PEP_ID=MMETSP1334-20130426/125571_1 /TAXON_ID=127549 /ORGANISM="Calcidiscus leptoporus, Strain RCC1130" /LENGTH=75 /DNA_ID=CAMNT_0007416581 /DNA_START=14 /DNA_END=237 /DNA_ORIENTATION=+
MPVTVLTFTEPYLSASIAASHAAGASSSADGGRKSAQLSVPHNCSLQKGTAAARKASAVGGVSSATSASTPHHAS